jgi:hypothetical protein
MGSRQSSSRNLHFVQPTPVAELHVRYVVVSGMAGMAAALGESDVTLRRVVLDKAQIDGRNERERD